MCAQFDNQSTITALSLAPSDNSSKQRHQLQHETHRRKDRRDARRQENQQQSAQDDEGEEDYNNVKTDGRTKAG